MLTFIDFKEKYSEVYDDAKKSVDIINDALERLFPNKYGKAFIGHGLGIDITLKCAPNMYTEGAVANNISENDPGYLAFIMHVDSDMSRGKYSFESLGLMKTRDIAERGGKKYRKISGKTIEEASRKLVKWLESNKDAIKV